MNILKEISREKLVVVITHDLKICDFASEVIHIQNKQIVSRGVTPRTSSNKKLVTSKTGKTSSSRRATKNFSIHFKRFVAVSLAISIGMLAFLFSLSFGNVMNQSINEFKEKNTAFNNGYIRGSDDGSILRQLKEDSRVENVYYQYKLSDVELIYDGVSQTIAEKIPTAKATEKLSYGTMPRNDKKEIAITPSLSKKFEGNINTLVGKQVQLKHQGKNYTLTISGIFNAGYDDFIVSSDVEKQLYSGITGHENYSVNYDVKEFTDIVAVDNLLKMSDFNVKNAAKEVYALQKTFADLNKLFFIISIVIVSMAVFICTVLLVKLQSSRYREVGLLSALGFSKGQITSMILYENLLLASLATVMNLALLSANILFGKLTNFPFNLTSIQLTLSIVATFITILFISMMSSYKLVKTEPAEALRK